MRAVRWLENLKWGVTWGMSMASLYIAWVTLIRLVSGASPFDRLGTTYLGTVGAYVVGGALGGALVGLLRPLLRYLIGAIGVGIIVCLPVFWAIEVAMHGLRDSVTWASLRGDIEMSIIMGTILGAYIWMRHRPS